MIRVRITTGEGERRLARIKGRFANYRPVFEGPVTELLRDFFERQFASEGSYGGTPWEKLKESTLKRKGNDNQGILRRSDRLYDALTTFRAGRGRGIAVNVTNKGMAFRVNISYAKRHQVGTGRIPARLILPDRMPADFMLRLRNIITGYVLEGQFR